MKHKFSSLINIVGLSISFCIAILLAVYIKHELSFDSFHTNKDRIVRIVGAENGEVWTGPMLGESLLGKYPEIKSFVRARNNDVCVISYEGKNHLIKGNMAMDSSVLNVFDFKLISGDIHLALADPFSVVLTKKIANQIFGNQNPIGEIVSLNNYWEYTVTGLMENVPSNSTFDIDILFPFHAIEYQWKSNRDDPYNALNNKFNQSFHTYLLFEKGTNLSLAENKICPEIKEEYGAEVKFQALKNIYFDSNVGDRWLRKGSKSSVIILLSIGAGLMLISIFNYVNLSSALTIKNLPSLGIRKTIGADFIVLLKQYLLENTLYIALTFLIGFCFAYLLQPFLNTILGSTLNVSILFSFRIILSVLSTLVFLIILTSSFPLWQISKKINIANIRKTSISSSVLSSRNILVPVQFILTILFIVAALTISKQMFFVNKRDLGFNSEQLLYVLMNTERGINTKVFKEEVLKIPNVKNLSFSAGLFGDIRRGQFLEIDERRIHFNRIYTDAEYIPTLGYEIVEGRNFSNDHKSDFNDQVYIINEEMARQCEFVSPLEEQIGGHPIVGVVKDFHILPLQSKITPIAIVCNPDESEWVINIRMNNGEISQTVKQIEDEWNKLSPDFPMVYSFADSRILSYYQKESQISKISIIFSIVSVFLSCFGLIGLVMFTLQNKIKEIGVRKINGAKISEILLLLNTGFVKWVVIAMIVAFPISYNIMEIWLQNFAYKTALSWWIFALAGVLALGITLLTVSFQSWKAATRNPVEALRYE